MKQNRTIVMLLMLMLPLAAMGQEKKSSGTDSKKVATPKKTKSTSNAKQGNAAWGIKNYKGNSHLYYPDYHAFYDPNRGYVYWNMVTNNWTTSKEVPEFMSNVDMRRTRVQILEGLSLDLYPESNYPNYMKLYPARLNDSRVPVPNHRQERR